MNKSFGQALVEALGLTGNVMELKITCKPGNVVGLDVTYLLRDEQKANIQEVIQHYNMNVLPKEYPAPNKDMYQQIVRPVTDAIRSATRRDDPMAVTREISSREGR